MEHCGCNYEAVDQVQRAIKTLPQQMWISGGSHSYVSLRRQKTADT
jgi:hypothetical protein